MAVIQLVRKAGIPAPEIAFFNSDDTNELGYEYNCMESEFRAAPFQRHKNLRYVG